MCLVFWTSGFLLGLGITDGTGFDTMAFLAAVEAELVVHPALTFFCGNPAGRVSVGALVELGANPYLPPRYVLGSLWVLNQNTQHGPTRSI